MITKAPDAPVMPCPSTVSEASASPMIVTVDPPAAVCCWKTKSPVIATVPASVRVASSRLIRTKRPAGRSSSIVVGDAPGGATTNVCWTAAGSVLNWISAVPVKAAKPGIPSVTVPRRLPAAPPGVITKPPLAPVIDTTPPPSERATPAIATLTTDAPADVVACSIENEPDSVWPNTTIAPLPEARTY